MIAYAICNRNIFVNSVLMTGSLFIAFLYRLELKVAEIRHEGTECVISGKVKDFFIF